MLTNSFSKKMNFVKFDKKSSKKISGRWTKEEHEKFITALKIYGKNWKKIEEYLETRSTPQIRSHAQKFFTRLEKELKKTGSLNENYLNLKKIFDNEEIDQEINQELSNSSKELELEDKSRISKNEDKPKENQDKSYLAMLLNKYESNKFEKLSDIVEMKSNTNTEKNKNIENIPSIRKTSFKLFEKNIEENINNEKKVNSLRKFSLDDDWMRKQIKSDLIN